MKTTLIATASLGEQRPHVLAEHGEDGVRQPRLDIGHPCHQQRGPAQGFDIGKVLGGHDVPLLHQAGELSWVNPCGSVAGDPSVAHPIQPVEQRHHVRWCVRLWSVTQPSEAGPADGQVGHQQAVERNPLGLCDAVRQDVERPLPGTNPGGQDDPLQHGRIRYEHALSPEMGKHGLDDWLATVSGPRGVGADLKAVSPVAQSEAAQAEESVQLGRVLAPRLIPPGIVGECSGRNAELPRHEVQHRHGRLLARTETLTRMAQKTELHREAKVVHAAAFDPHQQQILRTEHVVLGHLGRRGRDVEQAGALVSR